NVVVTFTAPTANDNCDGSRTVICAPSSGSTFSLGTVNVVCSASDTHGNTNNSCTFSVTVAGPGNVAPTITCPSDITTSNAVGQCSASVSFVPIATGVPTPTVVCKTNSTVITSPNTFPVGTSSVTCTASN